MLIRAEAVSMTIVAEYVADLIVILTSTDKLNAVKKALSGRLKIKEMGHYCLGVSMILNADGIWLHQKQYVSLPVTNVWSEQLYRGQKRNVHLDMRNLE